MTHEDIVLKLLAAAGAASRAELVQDTGWGIPETNAVVDRLMASGRVVPFPTAGNNHAHRASKLFCLPPTRAEALKRPGRSQ